MINNVWSNLTAHHPKSQVSPITQYQRMESEIGPVETRVTYINKTMFDITVVDRSGFRHTVRTNLSAEDKFIIRTELRIRNDSIREVRKFLASIDSRFNHDLTIIKQIVIQNETSWNGYTVFLDHCISIEDIKKASGSIYCKPKDVVISLANIYNAPAHPYCEDSISDYILPNGLSEQELGSPVFKIELIDNNNLINVRYVFAFGGLQEIKPKTDLVRDSGVYLTMMEPNVLSDNGFSFVQKKFTFEEARDSLGLYKTKEEAVSAGDIHLARKEELARLEHSNNILKQESIELKAMLDKEAALRDKELKEQEAKLQEKISKLQAEKDESEHFREMERNARKEEYDKRSTERKEEYDRKSTERKDMSELIKFLPFVVMTIGALIAAFNKSSK